MTVVSKRLPGQSVSASNLQEVTADYKDRIVRRRAYKQVPEELMSELIEALRLVLERFVDPESDEIGHAFPIDGGSHIRSTGGVGGLLEFEYVSSLSDFASALLQAAAINGVDTVTRLLAKWVCGEPVQVLISTVLNGLSLNASVCPRDNVQILPLPLSTAELPRLPFSSNILPQDYLGLTMLTLRCLAAPVLFQPKAGRQERTVRYKSEDGVDFDLVCEAVSVHTNRHVGWTVIWHDYPDAASFCLDGPKCWSPGHDRLKAVSWKLMEFDDYTGGVRITLSDDVLPQRLDEEELRRTLEALRGADGNVGIAVKRWRRSKLPNAQFVDAYIDLRIVLESLYLRDFANENNQEMRFRLALFGAWYLAEEFDERCSIRKILRNAYDTASKAVHSGKVPKSAGKDLRDAQDLCRRGILKFLQEGPPKDWGDLVLGAPDP